MSSHRDDVPGLPETPDPVPASIPDLLRAWQSHHRQAQAYRQKGNIFGHRVAIVDAHEALTQADQLDPERGDPGWAEAKRNKFTVDACKSFYESELSKDITKQEARAQFVQAKGPQIVAESVKR